MHCSREYYRLWSDSWYRRLWWLRRPKCLCKFRCVPLARTMSIIVHCIRSAMALCCDVWQHASSHVITRLFRKDRDVEVMYSSPPSQCKDSNSLAGCHSGKVQMVLKPSNNPAFCRDWVYLCQFGAVLYKLDEEKWGPYSFTFYLIANIHEKHDRCALLHRKL